MTGINFLGAELAAKRLGLFRALRWIPYTRLTSLFIIQRGANTDLTRRCNSTTPGHAEPEHRHKIRRISPKGRASACCSRLARATRKCKHR
jgi:hypothetical protein